VDNNDNRPDKMEIALVIFLVCVVIIAVLTILGPQIESVVRTATGR
jgi:Tfp pilus assembly major pilin PilA